MSGVDDLEKLRFLLEKVFDEASADLRALAGQDVTNALLLAVGERAEKWRRSIERDNPEWKKEIAYRLKRFGVDPARAYLVARRRPENPAVVEIGFDPATLAAFAAREELDALESIAKDPTDE